MVLPVGGDDSSVEAPDGFLELDDLLVGEFEFVGVDVGDEAVQV